MSISDGNVNERDNHLSQCYNCRGAVRGENGSPVVVALAAFGGFTFLLHSHHLVGCCVEGIAYRDCCVATSRGFEE
jgi:hypothetical protein